MRRLVKDSELSQSALEFHRQDCGQLYNVVQRYIYGIDNCKEKRCMTPQLPAVRGKVVEGKNARTYGVAIKREKLYMTMASNGYLIAPTICRIWTTLYPRAAANATNEA